MYLLEKPKKYQKCKVSTVRTRKTLIEISGHKLDPHNLSPTCALLITKIQGHFQVINSRVSTYYTACFICTVLNCANYARCYIYNYINTCFN